MAVGNRSGGPRSEQGKAKSSKNALKLGVTTMNIASSDEQKMVDEYVQELMDYYHAESPLEKLQIQRIAVCRAKLARLYQVEQLRLQLTQKNIENDPEQIFKEMNVRKGLVRSMALEGIRHGGITLPCNLSFGELEAIAAEVDHFHGTLKSERDLEESFPRLVKFLRQYSARGLNQSTSLLERFEVVAHRIYRVMRQDIYLGNLGELLEELLSSNKKQISTDDQDAIDLMSAINPNYVPPEPAQYQVDIRQLQSLMPLFVHLKCALKDAQLLIDRYQESKSLLVQSTLLPQSEADLLMRYQTTLERRLSSSLGELLELQKRR